MSSILSQSWPSAEIDPPVIIVGARPSEQVPDAGDEAQIEESAFYLERLLGETVEIVELPVNETHKFQD